MKRRSFFYWIIGIVITAIIIWMAFCLDNEVRDFITAHQNKTAEKIAGWVSFIGDWPLHYYPGLVIGLICWWRGRKRWVRIVAAMLIALCLAGLVSRGINMMTGRARPSVGSQEIWHGIQFGSKYHAFPSGHVASSTAFWAALFFANRRLGAPFLAIPFVIGLSRMYLGAHYLSDVVCGAVLGILSARLVAPMLLRRDRQPSLSVPHVELSVPAKP